MATVIKEAVVGRQFKHNAFVRPAGAGRSDGRAMPLGQIVSDDLA